MVERRKIAEQGQFLLKVMSSKDFLESARSLTTPSSFILPYDPADATAADEIRAILVRDLKTYGIDVADANLYDTVLSIMDADELFDEYVIMQKTMPTERFTAALKDAVDLEEEIVPALRSSVEGKDLLFISGVGECYPFLRTHQLLENLSVDVPVVTFFPGDYRKNADGTNTLDILDIPQGQGGGFYRARNIYEL